jgi:catechol 2,3-dioxygenase-like lactoylglutathione lyase family enzyme
VRDPGLGATDTEANFHRTGLGVRDLDGATDFFARVSGTKLGSRVDA